jgi:hypothetical protein
LGRVPGLQGGRRGRAAGVAVLPAPRGAGRLRRVRPRPGARGGGDAPESGLEAVALAVNSPWTTSGDRRRQVIVVWTDSPAQPLTGEPAPAPFGDKIPKDFSALTDLWENEQGVMGTSSKRLIVLAPDGPGWTDISGVWENVVHHPSKAGEGLFGGRLRHHRRLDRQLGVSVESSATPPPAAAVMPSVSFKLCTASAQTIVGTGRPRGPGGRVASTASNYSPSRCQSFHTARPECAGG